MTVIRIEPSGPLGGYLHAPPSKNYTARHLTAAALARGSSRIRRPADNDDARALIECCRSLGAKITPDGADLIIDGVGGRPKSPGTLNPDNAGAVLRLLLGVACLADGETRFETRHADSLGRRPNEDLLRALRELGADARGTGDAGTLPVTIRGRRDRLTGRSVHVSGANSSQYLSSLLFLLAQLDGPREISVTGAAEGDPPVLVSRPLIDQTMEVLHEYGARIDAAADGFHYKVHGGGLAGGEHAVNGDWPSAAALMSAVAVAGGMVSITGLKDDVQGERRARAILESMGCRFTSDAPEQFYIHSKGALTATGINGDLATDAVLALEAAACFADGVTRFTGVANLKLKETDRINVPLEELKKVGVTCIAGDDWIEITGRPEGYEGGIEVDCRGDHRIAQMLAIVGLRCGKGLTLYGAECVTKSYPGFFSDLQRMGAKVRVC